MRISRTAKTVVIGLVAGTAVAAAGVGYADASASTKPVTACANAKNRLAVASSKGKCPKGFTTITLNTRGPQGPRGAAGAKGAPGAKGATGAAGPGARRLYLTTPGSGETPPVQVGPFGYALECDVTKSGSSTSAVATVHILAPAGLSASINTIYSATTGSSTTPTTQAYRKTFTGETTFYVSSTDQINRVYVDAMRVVGADGTVQLLSVDVAADTTAGAANHCLFSGMVIPSS